jgi:hypothetical protein
MLIWRRLTTAKSADRRLSRTDFSIRARYYDCFRNVDFTLWLALIDHHHATFDHDFRLKPVPVAFQRIAVKQDDVGEFTRR